MRKITQGKINKLLFLLVLLILALGWAALDDITTGSELDYWIEWDFLLFSAVIFGLIIYSKFSRDTR